MDTGILFLLALNAVVGASLIIGVIFYLVWSDKSFQG